MIRDRFDDLLNRPRDELGVIDVKIVATILVPYEHRVS